VEGTVGDLVEFSAAGMSGWVREADPERRVLLLHGGPTMPHSYFESLVAVLPGWSVASYQQRGRAPSTSQGPFVVPTLIDDLAGVLDHLSGQGWDRPLLAGHSWGGYLVWHAATTLASRIGGALAIDPMGAVGDMGLPAFGAAIMERMTPGARARSDELEERWESPGLTEAESIEQSLLHLPGYFADPANVEKFLAAGEAAPIGYQFDSLMRSARGMQPLLEAALPAVRVPVGALHGAASPMPTTASTDATDLIPGAWTEVVDGAGHLIWLERHDAVATALDRLRVQQHQGSAVAT
jgi:pimeloyl-ACP methyl ester carboxylesterase